MAMTKVKALQLWCKKMAEGYRDVEVQNMAASWKSGLAFCAIIHRFRPDLIDYDSLAKENVFENNDLAFEVAEKELSIPAFLEAADMVAIRVPDKLSVVTYVSQYYNYFHNKPQLGGPGVSKFVSPSKRKDNKPPSIQIDTKSSFTPQKKDGNAEIKRDRQESMGDKCSMCHEKVYLMERHIENAKLYHRRCFRNSEMSPQSKVFKRQPYSPISEQNESQSTKFRKIDNDTRKDTREKFGSKPDYLKKQSEGKGFSGEFPKASRQYDMNTNSQVTPPDVPSWKKADNSRDVKTEKTSAFPKTDLKDRFGATATKAEEPKPRTVNYVNKFKELDERNLKTLNDSSGLKPSEQNKISDKSRTTSKADEPAKQFPVPKPRQNIGKAFEKMDTSETPVQQSPVKNKWDASSSATSKTHDIKGKVPQETKKTDFSRPKTPPNSHTSQFSLNVSNNNTGRSSPVPVLPDTSPPRLPASQPPSVSTVPASQPAKLDFNKSAVSSPRLDTNKSGLNSPKSRDKFNKTKQETKAPLRPHHAPAKPPRVTSEVTERSASPMDTGEKAVLSTAIVHEPSEVPAAVLVVPKRHDPNEEQKNRQVLGGLLKSLADIRKQHDVKHAGGDHTGQEASSSSISANRPEVKVDLRTKNKNEDIRSGEPHAKPRPKTSFVSQNRGLFSDTNKNKDIVSDTKKTKDESQGKTKVVTTTKTVVTTKTKTTAGSDQKPKDTHKVVEKTKVTTSTDDKLNKTDSDMPEWKRKLEEKKRERARPKSADLLSDKNENSSAGMLDWQKEAAKRKEARKGGYVDPEKAKPQDRNLDSKTDSDQISRPMSPTAKVSPRDRNTNNISDKVPQSRPMSPPEKVSPRDRNTSNISDKVPLSRPLSPPPRKPVEPANFTHKQANGFKEDKNKFEKSKSPERSHIDLNKTKEKDSAPKLKPVELKKKILFDNNTDNDKTLTDMGGKKKVGLAQKFVFESVELKPTPKKPLRPAESPMSPTSPKLTPPSRPPPPKTSPSPVTKHHISTHQIQRQLRLIDERLTELELKGRTLEDSIRNANDEEEDELMINWFELINDKNDLVRRECDLVYISKQQELEIDQDKIEQQLRHLIDKPDNLKTEADREEEVRLLEKKVDVVYQRNNIVDSIDEDRLRYIAEDKDIEEMLQNKGFLKDNKEGKLPKKTKR